jgi:hypothetical protein
MTQTQKVTKTVNAVVRKPYDSVQTLVSKITFAIAELQAPDVTKDRFWVRMNRASDAGNPKELVKVLGSVRNANRREKHLVGLQQEWSGALKAAEAFVKAENAKGHKGQSLFDLALRPSFVKVQDLINNFPTSREKLVDLEQEIVDLKFQVDNFIYDGKFCRTCGEPIGDISFGYCLPCHHAYVQEHPRNNTPSSSVEQPKRKIKKPGSASRRSSGPRPEKAVKKAKK